MKIIKKNNKKELINYLKNDCVIILNNKKEIIDFFVKYDKYIIIRRFSPMELLKVILDRNFNGVYIRFIEGKYNGWCSLDTIDNNNPSELKRIDYSLY